MPCRHVGSELTPPMPTGDDMMRRFYDITIIATPQLPYVCHAFCFVIASFQCAQRPAYDFRAAGAHMMGRRARYSTRCLR